MLSFRDSFVTSGDYDPLFEFAKVEATYDVFGSGSDRSWHEGSHSSRAARSFKLENPEQFLLHHALANN